MLGDPCKHVAEPSLWVDVVHFRCEDQAVHGGGAHAAAIGACKKPRLPSQRDATQGSLGGIIGKANAPVVEEAREALPALQL
jgi:hypothetical protein